MAEPDISLLQTMFQRLLDGQGGLLAELHEIKQRTTSIERHIAGIRRDMVLDTETVVNLNDRVDRFDRRLERIERRLDLTGA
jgi:hypothetical protein